MYLSISGPTLTALSHPSFQLRPVKHPLSSGLKFQPAKARFLLQPPSSYDSKEDGKHRCDRLSWVSIRSAKLKGRHRNTLTGGVLPVDCKQGITKTPQRCHPNGPIMDCVLESSEALPITRRTLSCFTFRGRHRLRLNLRWKVPFAGRFTQARIQEQEVSSRQLDLEGTKAPRNSPCEFEASPVVLISGQTRHTLKNPP